MYGIGMCVLFNFLLLFHDLSKSTLMAKLVHTYSYLIFIYTGKSNIIIIGILHMHI